MTSRENKAITAGILLFAFVVRAGVLWLHQSDLANDPDAYRSVADGLLEGEGFSNRVTGEPTAFRPPLYPLLLAGLLKFSRDVWAIALLHLVAGTATVWLTLRIGRQLELGKSAAIAALLVAVDPLLLQYTSYVMTETIFTLLLTALLAVITCDCSRVKRQIAVGILFGLCALCRPTVWPVGLLAAAWWGWRLIISPPTGRRWRAIPWITVLCAAAVVSPWLIRNTIALGSPIITTTHGGYTLLLGNNPVYYRQEVNQPFGIVWEDAPPGETQQDWLRDLRVRMADELGSGASEPKQDRWMYQQAFQTIEEEPRTFFRACLLRFVKFWNVVPLGSARAAIPNLVIWGVAGFYFVEMIGFLFGLTRVPHGQWSRWMPLWIAIAGFCLVHLVFWTNARMRAPVIPAISLFFAVGWHAAWRASRTPQQDENGPAQTSHNS